MKKNDNVFRWGGEEICILLTADEEQAVSAAERIRADIARDAVNYRNEANVSVTVTMGVSPYKDGMSIQDMMDDADAKLYWGKQHGKNQVVSGSPRVRRCPPPCLASRLGRCFSLRERCPPDTRTPGGRPEPFVSGLSVTLYQMKNNMKKP